MIAATLVQKLREHTGAGVMDCKNALTEAKGDLEKAKEVLRNKGISLAAKKAGRATREGLVGCYLHMGGRIGVLVEVNCETDFVSRNEDFQKLIKELAMQVAATAPRWLSRSEVPAETVQTESAPGKDINKFYEKNCLLDQPYIRDSSGKQRISDLVQEAISKIGENIVVRRFVRMQVGEE